MSVVNLLSVTTLASSNPNSSEINPNLVKKWRVEQLDLDSTLTQGYLDPLIGTKQTKAHLDRDQTALSSDVKYWLVWKIYSYIISKQSDRKCAARSHQVISRWATRAQHDRNLFDLALYIEKWISILIFGFLLIFEKFCFWSSHVTEASESRDPELGTKFTYFVNSNYNNGVVDDGNLKRLNGWVDQLGGGAPIWWWCYDERSAPPAICSNNWSDAAFWSSVGLTSPGMLLYILSRRNSP